MNKTLKWALILAPSAYLFVTLWANMLGDPFPPFNDPAIWLKLANALVGNSFPMWGETTFQYPPLFPAFVAVVSGLTGNELLALKILGAGAIAAIPLSSYPLLRNLSGSDWISVSGVWLAAFAPIFMEMFGWGGYPNALGIVFLTLAMGYCVIAFSKPTMLNIGLAFVFSFLTALSHHLTFIIFAGGFVLATAGLLTYTRELKKFYAPLISLAGGGAGFILWRVLAGPFQYELYNGASLAIRPLDLDAISWTFKSWYVLGALLGLAAVGGFWLYRNKKYFELALLVSFSAVPYLAAQSYLVGIALDFRRFPAFSAVPLSILAALSLCWMSSLKGGASIKIVGGNEPRIEGSLSPLRVGLALAFIFLFVGTIQVGVATEAAVFQYYHSQTDYAYPGSARYQAINWLKTNTSQSAVIVADEVMGRWTEGYGQRRVLMDLAPYQSFITGEVPRAEAANLILGSNVEIANPYLRMRDGTPYQLSNTPTFGYSDGLDYHDTVFVADAYVRTAFTRSGSNWIEAPYNPVSFSMGWTQRTSANATMQMNFETQGLIVNKSLSMTLNSQAAEVLYVVTPKNGSVLTSLSLPIWIPFGSYGTFASIGTNAFSISDNGVPITVTPVGDFSTVSFGPDNATKEQRLLLTFTPVNNRIVGGFTLSFPDASPVAWRSTLDANTSDELIAQYQVSYLAVGVNRFDVSRYMTDPRMKLVYQNAQIDIFEIFKPA